MDACEICGGAGVVERDDKLYECECAELRRIVAAMPSYIRTAVVDEKHLKIILPDKKTRVIESINKSLYVTAYWGDMRAIIKTIMIKHRNKFIRITSDRELRDVFVGSTSRAARGENSKESIYNSIEDLVKSPDLLMIRLNELGYKNKAAPGILEEALCYRLDRALPVWLLSNSTKPFGAGSFAYSENIWSLVMSIPRIRVEPILIINGPIDPTEFTASESDVGSSFLAPEQAKPQERKISKPKTIRSDDDLPSGLGAFGKGIKPSSGFRRG